MQLLVLSENSNLHSSRRLLEEANGLNLNASCKNPYEQLISPLEGNEEYPQIVLHRCTGYRFDDFDLNYSTHLKLIGSKVFNDPNKLLTIRDKQWQAKYLENWKLPSIPTFGIRGRPGPDQLESLLKISDKFVIKSTRGNGGLGTTLVQGKKSLISLLETFWAMKDQRFIIQPFLEEIKEYRLFFAKEKFFGALEKQKNEDDFRANFKCHSNALFLNEESVPKEIFDIGLMAYQKSELDYTGLDILMTKDGPVVLEINTVPGFAQFEELSKINIAKELIFSLAKEFL